MPGLNLQITVSPVMTSPVAHRKESSCCAGAVGDVDSLPGWGGSPDGGHGVYCLENTSQFPCGSAGKESACNVGDLCSVPGLGRSPGEGRGYPLWYSGLENAMDCIVRGVTKSRTRLSDFHFPFTFCLGESHGQRTLEGYSRWDCRVRQD